MLIQEYNRIFEEKHEIGGLLVFNFSESLNTISGSSDFASLPSRNMGLSWNLDSTLLDINNQFNKTQNQSSVIS